MQKYVGQQVEIAGHILGQRLVAANPQIGREADNHPQNHAGENEGGQSVTHPCPSRPLEPPAPHFFYMCQADT